MLIARQRPARAPNSRPWRVFRVDCRHRHDLNVQLVIHAEAISIRVVYRNVQASPLRWYVLNDRVWIHPAHSLQMEHLLVASEGGLTIEVGALEVLWCFAPH